MSLPTRKGSFPTMKLDLTALEQARVLVVGDVMLDRYWHGGTSRISPEAPVPVVRVEESEDRPGGAANVALNIASLGAHAALSDMVGDDDNARRLSERLEAAGVATYFESSPGIPTITKLRVMSRNQQLIRLDFEDGLDELDTRGLLARVEQGLAHNELVILSDYGKGTLNRVEELIGLVRGAGKRVLVDPKGTDFTKYRGASVLTPNLAEFEAVVALAAVMKSWRPKGRHCVLSWNLKP